jgi:hypothetical protein
MNSIFPTNLLSDYHFLHAYDWPCPKWPMSVLPTSFTFSLMGATSLDDRIGVVMNHTIHKSQGTLHARPWRLSDGPLSSLIPETLHFSLRMQ